MALWEKMNVTDGAMAIPHNTTLHSTTAPRLTSEFLSLILLLLVPTLLLYASIYSHLRGSTRVYQTLVLGALITFVMQPRLAGICCGPLKSLQHLAVGVGVMKILDLFARRSTLPRYTASKISPAPWLLALIMLVELRYESFTPNHIRRPRRAENFSEAMQLAIHTGAFAVLQTFPQHNSTILAFEILLAIYIIWTSCQMLVRYKTSPSLFGPLYLADSIAGFWSETWHNVFASPCESLAYKPVRKLLPEYGVPVAIARSVGIFNAFVLMALFHVYALYPILSGRALLRLAMFFLVNGIATVCEAAVWGHRKHWIKVVLAWTFETTLATWTAEAMLLPRGLTNIPWQRLCEPGELS